VCVLSAGNSIPSQQPPYIPRTKRSRLQKAQSTGNLSHLNSGNKANSPPSVSPASEPAAVFQHTLVAMELELKHRKVYGKEYERWVSGLGGPGGSEPCLVVFGHV
jgi:hypothetical protein